MMHAQIYETVIPQDSVIHFLEVTLKKLGWYEKKEELVLDVGCGPGNVTLKYIFPLFSDVQKYVATDYSKDMIETAKRCNPHPQIEYCLTNIENKSDLKQWKGQVTKLVSIHCFNWLRNQKEGLQNVFDLLQTDGEAAFYFILGADYYAAMIEIYNDPKWNRYFEGVDNCIPESHYKKFTEAHYRKIAEDIGFTVVLCQDELKVNQISEQNAKDLYYSISVLPNHVPEYLKDDFKNDLYQYVVKNGSLAEDGSPIHRAVTLEMVLRKPKSNIMLSL